MSQNFWKPSSIVSIPFCRSHKPGAPACTSAGTSASIFPGTSDGTFPDTFTGISAGTFACTFNCIFASTVPAPSPAPFPAPSMMPHALQMGTSRGACIFLIRHLHKTCLHSSYWASSDAPCILLSSVFLCIGSPFNGLFLPACYNIFYFQLQNISF